MGLGWRGEQELQRKGKIALSVVAIYRGIHFPPQAPTSIFVLPLATAAHDHCVKAFTIP